jgi:hypothetical protein
MDAIELRRLGPSDADLVIAAGDALSHAAPDHGSALAALAGRRRSSAGRQPEAAWSALRPA